MSRKSEVVDHVVPYIGSWGQCAAEGGHVSCCLGDLCGASLRSQSLMAHWQKGDNNREVNVMQ